MLTLALLIIILILVSMTLNGRVASAGSSPAVGTRVRLSTLTLRWNHGGILMSTPLVAIAITRSDGVVTPRSPSTVIVSIVLVERIPLRRRMPVRFRLLALFPEVKVTVTLTII